MQCYRDMKRTQTLFSYFLKNVRGRRMAVFFPPFICSASHNQSPFHVSNAKSKRVVRKNINVPFTITSITPTPRTASSQPSLSFPLFLTQSLPYQDGLPCLHAPCWQVPLPRTRAGDGQEHDEPGMEGDRKTLIRTTTTNSSQCNYNYKKDILEIPI